MNELEVFKQTSDIPYDRHNYKIVLENGKKIHFDSYEEVHVYWFQHSEIPNYLKYVDVKDKKCNKGFGA